MRLAILRRLILPGLVLGALVLAPPAEAQRFRRPFACDACIANFYYFDEGAGSAVQDWSCATSSYDGHRGNDFSLRGGNAAIDGGHDVVAAAAGTVQRVQDGHFDRCTACGGSGCGLDFGYGFGNHVLIDHGSYSAVYAHLRIGSVRVAPGDTVTCGQAIGQIGSSGCSTGAHLHFETRPVGGASVTAFDPFEGACSPTTPSLWLDQGAHRGLPSATCDDSGVCPAGTYPIWTCNGERTQRRRCIDGVDSIEDCRWGCTVMLVGTDDRCAAPPDADGDGVAADIDCQDGDPSVYPGATDACGDGIDQDCSAGDALCPGADGGPRDGAIGGDGGGDPSTRDGGATGSELAGGCGCRAIPLRRASPPAAPLALAIAVVVARARARRSRRSIVAR